LTNQRGLTVAIWHDDGLPVSVSLRTRLLQTLAGTLIVLVALASVGLTAPADGLFTISVRPAVLRLDPESIAQSRAHAFGLDLDIKLGTLHVHFNWSAIPLMPATTKSAATLL
jgi:hypothetical protein